MRFQIIFAIRGRQRRLSYHYQYPISAWMYRVLQRADEEYSAFLHELGYQGFGKKFKFFTFSSLDLAPFRLVPEGIVLQGDHIRLTVSFCLDAVAEKFITGLFQNQELSLGDRQSQVQLSVTQVELLPLPSFDASLTLVPLSPLVVVDKVGSEGERDEYLSPDHPRSAELLLENLISKYVTYQNFRQTPVNPTLAGANLNVEVHCHKPPKSRLVTLKAGTAAETRVRGYYEGFSVSIHGPAEILRIGYLSGLGRYNASGFGCFGVRE